MNHVIIFLQARPHLRRQTLGSLRSKLAILLMCTRTRPWFILEHERVGRKTPLKGGSLLRPLIVSPCGFGLGPAWLHAVFAWSPEEDNPEDNTKAGSVQPIAGQ